MLPYPRQTVTCYTQCGTIVSYRYPYPEHTDDSFLLNQSWLIRVSKGRGITLTFNDFDVKSYTENKCKASEGALYVFSATYADPERLVGIFCNYNKQGTIETGSSNVFLYFSVSLKLVGTGRGFHLTYREVSQADVPVEGKHDSS